MEYQLMMRKHFRKIASLKYFHIIKIGDNIFNTMAFKIMEVEMFINNIPE